MSSIGSKIQNVIVGVITLAILATVGIALGPTITTAIAGVNTTGLALASVIELVFDYAGPMYYLALALGLLTGAWIVFRGAFNK